jgi:alkanesulfonate monooxygenase SsuD/methylene tetrahydromethanopterin reductase-like flavin-dependent oxidoreductase (luciferase family)
MEFGINFFPNVGPTEQTPEDYWNEALDLAGLCDELGYSHVRTVEHHFHPYGGYSPNPIVFLSAASQRSSRARLMTGAVIPAFNNPLKLAGEIGMLDAISRGRLDVGLARAFLPHEFARFGISMDESRERFEEGLDQVVALLKGENVTMEGKYRSFKGVTTLPRPTQRPYPPIYTVALNTPESFVNAGKRGTGLMAQPSVGPDRLRELLGVYRESWRAAGHPGNGRVVLAFMMYCAPDDRRAIEDARKPIDEYYVTLAQGAREWGMGTTSKDYPGYEKMIARSEKDTLDSRMARGAAWVGSPERLRDVVAEYAEKVGGFDSASLQVNTKLLPKELAESSMRLFAEKVIPHFASRKHAA